MVDGYGLLRLGIGHGCGLQMCVRELAIPVISVSSTVERSGEHGTLLCWGDETTAWTACDEEDSVDSSDALRGVLLGQVMRAVPSMGWFCDGSASYLLPFASSGSLRELRAVSACRIRYGDCNDKNVKTRPDAYYISGNGPEELFLRFQAPYMAYMVYSYYYYYRS